MTTSDDERPTTAAARHGTAGLTTGTSDQVGAAAAAPAGWRVLVPRPTAGQSGAVIALAAVGAEPVLVPLIAIDPPEDTARVDDALLALGSGWYRWLVVTSGAAVPVLDARARAAGRPLATLVADGDVRVAAVGPGTARALRDAGVDTDLTPRGPSTGANLAAQWPSADPHDHPTGLARPARVLFARGDLAASTVADGLRARGWQVDEVVAYRTVTAPPPPDDVRDDWRTGAIRAALLTSASTVRALVEHLGPPPASTLLVAIGPTTAAEAHRLGLPLAATAAEQTMTGLVGALVDAARSSDGFVVPPPVREDGRTGHQETP
ncbi:uroporphyrinogen-III synthase [Cellulomonas palmilytica]|uniref:uroporphyrinogen-III synthase n=1 Tax=Cellulomonas palmilytica TaxID=2608402 RepID=UPI001F3459F3|nr:uroporphyrinogen-III synthase [Cellulomonas palmilytica]UJP40490.1 uroporphyrinogen-III synthase [Cellulomonas palmilytica]